MTAIERFKLHLHTWKDGCGSEFCDKARNKVFARGLVPCDVCFVGEAPGESEDVKGIPFYGPAGALHDQIVSEGLKARPDLTVLHTNMVCCIPRNEENPRKYGEPTEDQITSCAGRLLDILDIATPRLIVAVGKVSKDYLTPGYKHSIKHGCPLVSIIHPAAIIKGAPAMRSIHIQRSIVAISNAVAEL